MIRKGETPIKGKPAKGEPAGETAPHRRPGAGLTESGGAAQVSSLYKS